MTTRRSFLALLVSVSAVGCIDALGPNGEDGFSVQFSMAAPEGVSPAELSALGSAFDAVRRYEVIIVDALTGGEFVNTTVLIASGLSVHTLDLPVPEDVFGRTVTITLIAYDANMELYRSVTTTTLGTGIGTIPVILAVRYTGPGVRGRVVDNSGNGLSGLTVGLYASGQQTPFAQFNTEPDGTFLFLSVPVGQYLVVPSQPNNFPYLCPGFRDLSVTSLQQALVADFTASATFCGTDVLILSGGDYDDTNAVAALLANDPTLSVSTFFYVNKSPGVSALRQYDVVLVFSNGLYDEAVRVGNELAEYVSVGGNVVIGSFYWQVRSDSGLGSLGWGALEGLDPFTSTGGATYQAGTLNRTSVVAHPLTSGLSTLTSTGFWGGVQARTGTTVVARWNDQFGTPLIGFRQLSGGQRVVGVSLFPASGASATGNVQALWLNAVTWAGAPGGPAPN